MYIKGAAKIDHQFIKLSETMKIAILVLALVAVACAASITGNIEEQVENRLNRLQQELEITKEMMTEMDESEAAIQAVDEVQKDLNVAKTQWGTRIYRYW